MVSTQFLTIVMVLAGIGQLALIVGSLAIPRVLGWKEKMAEFPTLLRQMFWVYAGYIWVTNLSFGLLSTFWPHLLLDGSALAGGVCTFIFIYWAARILIQIFYFDISELPKGGFHTFARYSLELLFVALSIVYGYIAVATWMGTIPA